MLTDQVVADRWDHAGRVAAYGGAAALTPYLLIKVSWVAGALAGVLPTGGDLRLSEWVALNTATIVMAAVGIGVTLALVRPWGQRIPGRLLLGGSWIGAGFLVPLLPYAVSGLVTGLGEDDDLPLWEGILIQAGFVGMGLGLAVALPAYVRRRWPRAMSGRLGERPLRRQPLVGATVVAGAGLAAAWTHRAVDDERALGLLFAAWALAAAAAMAGLVAGRPAGWPRWPALAVAWLGSGSLFAWGAWKLPLSLAVDTGAPTWSHAVGVLAGAVMVRALLEAERR